jgi:hypothetical protein
MVELATFESPYKRRTLGAETLDNLGAWRAAIDLYLRQAAAAGIAGRYEQIIFALQKLESHANLSIMLSAAFKDYIYSLGTDSARGYDAWRADYVQRQQAAEGSRAKQAEAAASAASAQAAAYAEAMRKKAEAAEESRKLQAERAAIAASEQADAEAAAAIIDAEAAAAVTNMENTIDAAQKGAATQEQVEQAAAVAVEAVEIQAKKDAFSKIVPLTIAAGLFILILRKV